MIKLSEVPASTWIIAARIAHATLTHAAALSPLPMLADTIGARCFLSDDYASGYLINADGDLQQVFSMIKGRGDAIVGDAVSNGARTLDCFDGYLPTLYARHGFRETAREPNWTAGGPDVIYMAIPTAVELARQAMVDQCDSGRCGHVTCEPES